MSSCTAGEYRRGTYHCKCFSSASGHNRSCWCGPRFDPGGGAYPAPGRVQMGRVAKPRARRLAGRQRSHPLAVAARGAADVCGGGTRRERADCCCPRYCVARVVLGVERQALE